MREFRLILASESPRRKVLLTDLGVRLKIISPQVDEVPKAQEPPRMFSHRLAREKAETVAGAYPRYWVLGADTVVVLADTILGKPKGPTEAAYFLRLLSGRTHKVITSFCLVKKDLGFSTTRSVVSAVTFKALTKEEIAWYVRTKEPLDKAGAYAIQGKGAFLVKSIKGSYTNVVGLPVTEVLETLQKYAGFQLRKRI
jgi:nucleoside triphosphate pyrophosphatase